MFARRGDKGSCVLGEGDGATEAVLNPTDSRTGEATLRNLCTGGLLGSGLTGDFSDLLKEPEDRQLLDDREDDRDEELESPWPTLHGMAGKVKRKKTVFS